MDPPANAKSFSYSKQQRSKKNKEKNKTHKEESSPNTSTSIKKGDPQPQRVNRGPRNEPVEKKNSADTQRPVTREQKENTENVVDHSNLKRETEEIAKLTRKFNKREITSNWHRYSAPESVVESQQLDEVAPADFSDLLQVPSSRGGHLQLKEEQDWSRASGSELSGYFALDLKQLSHSLACVPLYEKLKLPTQIFSEEEIKQFDVLAQQGRRVYKVFEDDPNTKLLKLNTSVVNLDFDSSNEITNMKNINNGEEQHKFDRVESKENLVNIFIEPESVNNKQQLDNKSTEWTDSKVVLNENYDRNYCKEKPKPLESSQHNQSNDQVVGTSALNLPETEKMHEPPVTLSERRLNISSSDGFENNYNISPFEDKVVINVLSENLGKKELCSNEDSENDVQISLTENNTSTTVPKEQRVKSKEPTDILGNTANKLKRNSLEDDDDDLDFLLSLKSPVLLKTKMESNPGTLMDSSFLPGKTDVTTASNNNQNSDLDDWLDSVLED